jgi:hypothetical protein
MGRDFGGRRRGRDRKYWLSAGLVAAVAFFSLAAGAQTGALNPEEATGKHAEPATRPSQPPAFSISVADLGFAAPGALYLGERASLASLDFTDENHLLFTFRVPGLIRRDTPAAGGDSSAASGSEERHIRAVLLALPAGAVEAEALWTLHDRAPYLSMLRDGHFLVRDGDQILKSDATLELKPYLRFPGPVLSVELDPSQQYFVTNSREAAATQAKTGALPTPETAAATVTGAAGSAGKNASKTDLLMRILRATDGKVMLFSHVRAPVYLPINQDGYLEQLRGRGIGWTLVLNYFTGGTKTVGQVDSPCMPGLRFVSQQELLATGCSARGGDRLTALTADGRKLWDEEVPATEVWPWMAVAADGARLARETLLLPYEVNANSPITTADIKGQRVRVYDAADGKVVLTAPASPVLDAGGNVAVSASGRRVAILDGGAIQVYELPAPPALPVPVQPAAKIDSAVK